MAHAGLLIAELKAAKDDPAALRKKIGEVKKFLDTPHPPPYTTALAEVAAELVERLGDDKLTHKTYKVLRNAVGAVPMGQDSAIYHMLTGALSRRELPGHEMDLKGKTIDGKISTSRAFGARSCLSNSGQPGAATACGKWKTSKSNTRNTTTRASKWWASASTT